MAKDYKINIKNEQLAKAIKLDSVKEKLAGKGSDVKSAPDKKTAEKERPKKRAEEEPVTPEGEEATEKRRVRARSRSAFAPTTDDTAKEAKPIEGKPKSIAKEPPPPAKRIEEKIPEPKQERLGPTGRHINDLLAPKEKKPERPKETQAPAPQEVADKDKKGGKGLKPKVFRDLKPARKGGGDRGFDARDRRGLSMSDDDRGWRKRRRSHKSKSLEETAPVRPSAITVRTPISIKDLASEMKLKASELISKLFMQGLAVTLNDLLDDETIIQLLGQEFGCEIKIDTSEAERIRITDRSIREEIGGEDPEKLKHRPPVITFMGHVDHGKTSLIDHIRKSNVASGEAGKITQHIGAFRVHTDVGDLTILDTPGHEAFSAMRARGANATDIVVLVIAGDEGVRDQTLEAIKHAKEAEVELVVAINKCDKPNFNAENIYRQLADIELLPETWGGQTITVNCSATTGEGIRQLLEMLVLQSEVLELKANPSTRARGTVLESEMHKGLGAVATILIMNGTLKQGDALVFNDLWGRVKTMRDQNGNPLELASPSTPVEITGLSGLPEAGHEFIVVRTEKEAREIAEIRREGKQQQSQSMQKRVLSMEQLELQATESAKKQLHIVLRADVQGSLEALKTSLEKIKSKKVDLDVISANVGEITESDVEMARSSGAVIIGFHTQIESHADPLIRKHAVTVRLHEVIYHAIDDVKELMRGLLDKIAEEKDHGKIEVRQIFKSSQHGVIAGCYVRDGLIHRNDHVRVIRNGEQIWKGSVNSLRRVKDDVREVQKGYECGILLSGFQELEEGDVLESFEITYIEQKL